MFCDSRHQQHNSGWILFRCFGYFTTLLICSYGARLLKPRELNESSNQCWNVGSSWDFCSCAVSSVRNAAKTKFCLSSSQASCLHTQSGTIIKQNSFIAWHVYDPFHLVSSSTKEFLIHVFEFHSCRSFFVAGNRPQVTQLISYELSRRRFGRRLRTKNFEEVSNRSFLWFSLCFSLKRFLRKIRKNLAQR